MTILPSIVVLILRISSIHSLVVARAIAFQSNINPNSNHQHHQHVRHPSFLRLLPLSSSTRSSRSSSSNPVRRHSDSNTNIILRASTSSSSLSDENDKQSSNDISTDDNQTTEEEESSTTTTTTSSSNTPTLQYQNEIQSALPLQQPPQFKPELIATTNNTEVETTGKTISYDYDIPSASESILAIDPSTIEIVPLSQIAQEEDDEFARTRDALSKRTTTTTTTTSPKKSSTTSTSTAPPPSPDFVSMFRGSANYIANHRNTIVVYHIPGELLDLDSFPELMDDIALTWLLGMKPVIVAGCRKQIDDKMKQRRRLRQIQQQQSGGKGGGDGSSISAVGTNNGNNGTQDETVDVDAEAPPRRYDGSIRVTDYDALRIVKEEAGYVRFELERQLGRALRMHHAPQHAHHKEPSSSSNQNHQNNNNNDENDTNNPIEDGNVVSGNFYSAQPYGVIDGVDFMYTGFPRRIEVEKIRQATLVANDVVLLTNLGASPSGEVFNVNSENLAASVAGSLDASKLIYFTGCSSGDSSSGGDGGGRGGVVFREVGSGKLVQNLRVSDAKGLLEYNGVGIDRKGFATIRGKGGGDGAEDRQHSPAVVEALVKVGWAIAALEAGVKRAHLIAPNDGALLQELYTRDGSGTLISRDLYEGIRPGNFNDVAGIFDLIEPLVKAGTLVPRPKTVLEKDADSYFVYTRDNLIVACAQLKLFEEGGGEEGDGDDGGGGGFAEIGCMVVSKEYRSQGRGDAMLGYLERLSLLCGCQTVFVLSTQTMEWFVERGFTEVNVDSLPPARRATYNYERRSKIYMKKIQDERDLDTAELWWNR